MNLISFSGHTFDLDRLPERPRVLDVGCRDFSFLRGVIMDRPGGEFHCYDPDPDLDCLPVDLFAFDVTVWRRALVGDHRKEVDYVSCGGSGNYIVDDQEKWRPTAEVFRVPACDIRDITDASKVEKWDLVKLDCEGSEFSILENWPRGGIAGQISVEFHDFKNPERWNQKYFEWLWTQLPDYEVVQHEYFKQGEAFGYWDSLLVRKEGL